MRQASLNRFDMAVCKKEKASSVGFGGSRNEKLGASIRIVGAPELSRFRTRVVMNEVLEGAPMEMAVNRALAITSRKESTK